jgi:CTP:molybdopterin cytidylyltransferase MocA
MEKEIRDFPLILIAGGQSSRMGTPKGLLNYNGDPWITEQLRRFKAASGSQAIIVLGFHQTPYFNQIPWMEQAVNQPVQHFGLEISVVLNPAPEFGQFSSLQSAIAFLQAHETDFDERRTTNDERSLVGPKIPGAFILPIDVPCPGKEVFQKLAETVSPLIDAAIPHYQSRGGHPVLLSAHFLYRLAEVPPGSPQARLDFRIQALPPERSVFVPVHDKHIHLNMNSMAIFQNYAQKKE